MATKNSKLKKIIVGNNDYYWNKITDTLYFDEFGERQVPLAYFDNYQYIEFLNQINSEIKLFVPGKPVQVNTPEHKPRKFNSGNKHQWQDDWDLDEQGELNEVEEEQSTSVGELPEQQPVKWTAWGETITVTNHADFTCVINPRGNYNAGIPTNEDVRQAKELVKRYNAYPDLERKVKDLIAGDTLHEIKYEKLQEQNRVLLEALKLANMTIKELAGDAYQYTSVKVIIEGALNNSITK